MKKRIEQLLNGKFIYEQPELLFSQEEISVTLKAGETTKDEIYFGTDDNRRISGFVTSSDRRLVPGFDRFSGTTSTHALWSGCRGNEIRERVLQGWLCFTTSIGEYRLPFKVTVADRRSKEFRQKSYLPGRIYPHCEGGFPRGIQDFHRTPFFPDSERSE